jgi:hypothetical protein
VKLDIAIAEGAEGGPKSPQGVLVIAGLIYLGVCCLAILADYKYQLRRARKRREAKEAAERVAPEEQSGTRKDGDDDGNRPA